LIGPKRHDPNIACKVPDGDWQWLVDDARRFKDPKYELMRGSPAAFGFTLTV
jgi:hypothetical protein